jgi:hypothetical protein
MGTPLQTLHYNPSRTLLFVHGTLWRNVDCGSESEYSIRDHFFLQSFMTLSEDMALQREVLFRDLTINSKLEILSGNL